MTVTVIGAGLAGCEAAWQIARRGVPVVLIEMKPKKKTPAHSSGLFSELVCSNSLKAARVESAAGMLKQEMRMLSSLLMECADSCAVPAGGALAVDRLLFSRMVTEKIKAHPLIKIREEEIVSLPRDGVRVVATGPLTSGALAADIAGRFGGSLSFFDAAAPIVTRDSIDMERAFCASRYDKGGDDDYINCPMDEEEYKAFYRALIDAQTAPIHGFEESKVFEGCMPVESMARRGEMALAFGPLKPVGLVDPRSGRQPFAVLQLRRDDASDSLYNLVGFQTRLKFPEQKRVFGMIPGLEEADYARYGVMHRNTFINSPQVLGPDFMVKGSEGIYFAGQITGVEGYVESAASGLAAGIQLALRLRGRETAFFPASTAIGSLSRYISTFNRNYQPMHVSFGLIDPLKERVRGKEQRYLRVSEIALETIEALKPQLA